jgi:hypothetical protein
VKIIKNLNEVRLMPNGVIKKSMQTTAELVHAGDAEITKLMEEGFSSSVGGNWLIFEEGDNPRRFCIDESDCIDLLSDAWNWCDAATLEDGCFFIFWGTNNAGGPCLFVADEPWIPLELRQRLEEWIASVSV